MNASLVHSTRPAAKELEAHEVKAIILFQSHTVAGKKSLSLPGRERPAPFPCTLGTMEPTAGS
jgi:hypothetical protein